MDLENFEVLQTMAEVSVTLAGFIGVILVLKSGSSTDSERADRNAIFHLLLSSLGVAGLALLPLIVQALFDNDIVWRVCVPVMGLMHLMGASKGLVDFKRGELGFPIPLIWVFAPVSYVLVLLSVAVMLGYVLEYASAIYLMGLGWSLIVAAASFLTLIFRDDA